MLNACLKERIRNTYRVAVITTRVHLTFPPHIFSVHVKSGTCYITRPWRRGLYATIILWLQKQPFRGVLKVELSPSEQTYFYLLQ